MVSLPNRTRAFRRLGLLAAGCALVVAGRLAQAQDPRIQGSSAPAAEVDLFGDNGEGAEINPGG